MQRKFKSFNIPFVPKKIFYKVFTNQNDYSQSKTDREDQKNSNQTVCPSLENFCLLHPDNSSKNVSIIFHSLCSM